MVRQNNLHNKKFYWINGRLTKELVMNSPRCKSLKIEKNKNLDNSIISSTYHQKDNIWKLKGKITKVYRGILVETTMTRYRNQLHSY